jgi:hypothetical protein
VLPSESLIEEIATSRCSFKGLRDKALELVGLLAGSPAKTHEEIRSMKELETLLQLATEAQKKRRKKKPCCVP